MDKKNKSNLIKNNILEVLKDGKEHTTAEIREYIESKRINDEDNSNAINMALFQLKKESETIANPRKGIYCMINKKQKIKKDYYKGTSKYDFSDFEIIESKTKKEIEMVVSITEEGTLSINEKLLKQFDKREAEIKIKKDCKQIILLKNGNSMIYLGKNGRQKNYNLLDKLKGQKISLPAYYTGKWDEEEELWIGDLTDTNPNRARKKQNTSVKRM